MSNVHFVSGVWVLRGSIFWRRQGAGIFTNQMRRHGNSYDTVPRIYLYSPVQSRPSPIHITWCRASTRLIGTNGILLGVGARRINQTPLASPQHPKHRMQEWAIISCFSLVRYLYCLIYAADNAVIPFNPLVYSNMYSVVVAQWCSSTHM